MVMSVTNMGRSGVFDYLVQRLTAVVMAAYLIFLVGFILFTPDLGYTQWQALFEHLWMRVFSLLTLLSIMAHAWIGLWAVLTDYLTERAMGKLGSVLRLTIQVILALVALTYTVWGVEIIWGL